MLGVVEREILAVRSIQARRRGSHKVRRMRSCKKLVRGFLVWWLWWRMVLIFTCSDVRWYVV